MASKINLNKEEYDNLELLTDTKLLELVDSYDVFSHYIGKDVPIKTAFNSPLRNDDIPSFALFYGTNAQRLMYKDFATGDSGDVIVFVQKMFGYSTYFEALSRIASDFKITGYYYHKLGSKSKVVGEYVKRNVPVKHDPVNLGIKRRSWNWRDKQFWSSFCISKKTLEKYWVSPVSYIFFNGSPVKVEPHAYAYKEYKDNKVSYKIYQPFSKNNKWINNANDSVHQGYRQLPSEGELLILTKSLKDVMSIHDTAGIPSVALQSESITIKESVLYEYQQRFDEVILLWDNDAPGRKHAARFGIPKIFMPEELGKDYSDVAKAVGKKEVSKLLKSMILNNRNKQRK